MDLQEANNAMMHQHSHTSSIGSLNFNRFIGSLGSSLPAPGEPSSQVPDDEWTGVIDEGREGEELGERAAVSDEAA